MIKRLLKINKSRTFLRDDKQSSNKVRGKFKDNLAKIVSYTTRPPRNKEKKGQDYIFVSRQEFKDRIRKRKFLEWQKVLGEYYGTPRASVEKNILACRDVLLCIDVKGAEALKRKKAFRSRYIFILPSDQDWQHTLKQRLKRRCSDSRIEMRKRLVLAEKEMNQAKYYDYVVVNKNINQTARELADIIASEREMRR